MRKKTLQPLIIAVLVSISTLLVFGIDYFQSKQIQKFEKSLASINELNNQLINYGGEMSEANLLFLDSWRTGCFFCGNNCSNGCLKKIDSINALIVDARIKKDQASSAAEMHIVNVIEENTQKVENLWKITLMRWSYFIIMAIIIISQALFIYKNKDP